MTCSAPIPPLPALLAEIADVVGFEAMETIARARGGARCRFPGRLGPDHWLARLIGFGPACALCRHFAPAGKGIELEMPLGPFAPAAERRNELDQLILAGSLTPDQIAVRCRTTRRTVLRRMAKLAGKGH